MVSCDLHVPPTRKSKKFSGTHVAMIIFSFVLVSQIKKWRKAAFSIDVGEKAKLYVGRDLMSNTRPNLETKKADGSERIDFRPS